MNVQAETVVLSPQHATWRYTAEFDEWMEGNSIFSSLLH